MAALYILQADELEYTFKRLVDGLAHTREAARPGFSLALGQVSRYQKAVRWSLNCVYRMFGSNHSFHTHVFRGNSYMCLSSSTGLFYLQSITIWNKIYQLLEGGFLWQVLNAFEDVTLQSTLNRIKQKHNLQTVKKVSCFITLIDIYSSILFQRCLGLLAVQ